MSHLSSHIEDYLAMRRALGFKRAQEGRLLRDFAAFAEAAGAGTVTTDLAVAWPVMPPNASPVRAAQRRTMVRGFARYLQAADPAPQVPPVGVRPARTRRVTPCIYSDAEVAALMTAARMLRNPLKAATVETLIGLLAVTGTRGSEAMALDRGDLDATAGLLTVRATKFRKSRQLPPQVTTLEALAGYQAVRDQLCPAPATAGPAGACDRGAAVPGHRAAGLPPPAPPGRDRPGPAAAPRDHPRPASQLRGQHPARLVPGRPGRAGPHAVPVDLARSRRPGRHVLVLLRFPGYSDTRSLARVTGLWPGMTHSRDCRLPG